MNEPQHQREKLPQEKKVPTAKDKETHNARGTNATQKGTEHHRTRRERHQEQHSTGQMTTTGKEHDNERQEEHHNKGKEEGTSQHKKEWTPEVQKLRQKTESGTVRKREKTDPPCDQVQDRDNRHFARNSLQGSPHPPTTLLSVLCGAPDIDGGVSVSWMSLSECNL